MSVKRAVYLMVIVLVIGACGEEDPTKTPEGTVATFQLALETCNFEKGWELLSYETRYEEYGSFSQFQLWCMNQREEVRSISKATVEKVQMVTNTDARIALFNKGKKNYSVLELTKHPDTNRWIITSLETKVPRHKAY